MATLVICQPISMTYRLKFSLVAQPIDAANHRSFTPWAESFDSVPESQIRVLDVACGTGRTLKLSVLCLKHLFWYRFVTRLLA